MISQRRIKYEERRPATGEGAVRTNINGRRKRRIRAGKKTRNKNKNQQQKVEEETKQEEEQGKMAGKDKNEKIKKEKVY